MSLNVPNVKFYNGNEIPIFGLGTWKVSGLTSYNSYNLVTIFCLNLFIW